MYFLPCIQKCLFVSKTLCNGIYLTNLIDLLAADVCEQNTRYRFFASLRLYGVGLSNLINSAIACNNTARHVGIIKQNFVWFYQPSRLHFCAC